jgi:hypothetical protein
MQSGLLVLAVVCTACVASTRALTPPQPNVLIAEELLGANATNLYDAIIRLRPGFFATRGYTSFINEPANQIVVVINRSIQGGLGELRTIAPAAVRTVRRLSASDVYQLTGRSAPSGGIEVVFGP